MLWRVTIREYRRFQIYGRYCKSWYTCRGTPQYCIQLPQTATRSNWHRSPNPTGIVLSANSRLRHLPPWRSRGFQCPELRTESEADRVFVANLHSPFLLHQGWKFKLVEPAETCREHSKTFKGSWYLEDRHCARINTVVSSEDRVSLLLKKLSFKWNCCKKIFTYPRPPEHDRECGDILLQTFDIDISPRLKLFSGPEEYGTQSFAGILFLFFGSTDKREKAWVKTSSALRHQRYNLISSLVITL